MSIMLQTTIQMLLQLSLLSLASAAPVSIETHQDAWRYGAGGGVIGFIVLILDLIVFGNPPTLVRPSITGSVVLTTLSLQTLAC